jgi:hypothetical protein
MQGFNMLRHVASTVTTGLYRVNDELTYIKHVLILLPIEISVEGPSK